MPASPLLSPPAPSQPGPRRCTAALMWLGMAQLALWLGTALYDFYAGPRLLLLPVRAGLKFGASHPHLSATLASPVGYYSTGTQGELLYQPTTFSDYFLFYHVGSLGGLDALFLAGVGIYLYRTLGRRPLAQAFTPAASQALGTISLASCLLYVLTMALDGLASTVFEARTQHFFTLGGPHSASVLYVVLGLVLGVCSRYFQQGQQLQQEGELTI